MRRRPLFNYLYRIDVRNNQHLEKLLPDIISDYNNRPHISLDGLTPNEAEKGTALDRDRLRIYVDQATLAQKVYNQTHQCAQCSD